jgi:multicomponent Na+:H+ antiporter subunit D
MTAALALMALLATPLAHALAVLVFSRPPGLRDFVNIGFALAAAVLAVIVFQAAAQGETARIVLARPLPNVDLGFVIEPLGALAAVVVTGLGFLHAVHAVGMVRASAEKAPARLMAFMALTIAAVLAVAFSANLFSLFIAYQALILAAFPLVAHRGDDEARAAGRTFLATLLASSIVLLLPAMIGVYALSGALDFQPGGVLAGRVGVLGANVLLVLFVFGLAMAAMPPMHRWLTLTTRAPYPTLVIVQALAVLPAGGLALLKVLAYVFGPVLATARISAITLLALACVGMCVAALIALSRQDLRERLAYSCMAQALAVVVGGLLALPAGLFAAMLQIVATSCAATTLLMATGTVSVITGRTNVADFGGLGRVMSWTFAGFALASASMIGMPPFAGAWSRLWLITASASSGFAWAGALVGVAAVLTFAHLGPLAANAFADRAPADAFKRPDGASILLVAPVILCAVATLSLLVLADPLASFLSPVWTPP